MGLLNKMNPQILNLNQNNTKFAVKYNIELNDTQLSLNFTVILHMIQVYIYNIVCIYGFSKGSSVIFAFDSSNISVKVLVRSLAVMLAEILETMLANKLHIDESSLRISILRLLCMCV